MMRSDHGLLEVVVETSQPGHATRTVRRCAPGRSVMTAATVLSTPGATEGRDSNSLSANNIENKKPASEAGLYCFDTVDLRSPVSLRFYMYLRALARIQELISFRARNISPFAARSIDTDQPS